MGFIPQEALVGPVRARAEQDLFSLGVIMVQTMVKSPWRQHNLFCHPVSARRAIVGEVDL